MKILTKKIKKLRLSIHNVISAWYNEIDLRGEKMKFTSFVQLLHSGATNYPDNVALLYDEGGTAVKKTYAQLYADVKDRVRALESMKETCVGILEAPSEKWIVDMFACVIAGKQTVLLDAMSDAATLQKCVLATDVETILTDNLTAPYATALTFCPHTLNRTDGEGDILFFTSGTTESSKAVVLTSKSLCASAWNGQERCPCNENDNLLCILPLTHVFGFVCSMLWPLSQGACVSLTRGLRYLPFDAKYFNPTIISVVPSALKFLLNFNALNDNLRMVLVGAGPASEQVLDAVKAKGVEIRFGYGLTETSSGVAISTGENPFAMTPCPDDEITLSDDGEILIKCPECIMKGYYKNKTATDEVLINGVFHTGDLGKFDKDGNLYITGRKKDILVLENGTKIYLAEWETELQKALNIDDIALAQKNGVVTLFVGDKDGNIDKDDVKNKVNEFNKTKSFDRQIGDVCIMPHALERTATGKIKRWAL